MHKALRVVTVNEIGNAGVAQLAGELADRRRLVIAGAADLHHDRREHEGQLLGRVPRPNLRAVDAGPDGTRLPGHAGVIAQLGGLRPRLRLGQPEIDGLVAGVAHVMGQLLNRRQALLIGQLFLGRARRLCRRFPAFKIDGLQEVKQMLRAALEFPIADTVIESLIAFCWRRYDEHSSVIMGKRANSAIIRSDDVLRIGIDLANRAVFLIHRPPQIRNERLNLLARLFHIFALGLVHQGDQRALDPALEIAGQLLRRHVGAIGREGVADDLAPHGFARALRPDQHQRDRHLDCQVLRLVREQLPRDVALLWRQVAEHMIVQVEERLHVAGDGVHRTPHVERRAALFVLRDRPLAGAEDSSAEPLRVRMRQPQAGDADFRRLRPTVAAGRADGDVLHARPARALYQRFLGDELALLDIVDLGLEFDPGERLVEPDDLGLQRG